LSLFQIHPKRRRAGALQIRPANADSPFPHPYILFLQPKIGLTLVFYSNKVLIDAF
jgi:hypothetical protein